MDFAIGWRFLQKAERRNETIDGDRNIGAKPIVVHETVAEAGVLLIERLNDLPHSGSFHFDGFTPAG